MEEQIKILSLKPTGTSYRITIKGVPEPLMVPDVVVHQYRLKEGIVLTRSQLDMLQAEADLVRTDQTVARLLGMRDHTVGEIRTKLLQRGLPKDVVDKSVRKHKELGYLDDARTAQVLVERACRQKPSGRAFLLALLRRKMIERTLAERVVDRALEGRDEIADALEAIRRKWPVPEQIEVETVRTRVYSYLSRRGFGYRAAREAFSQHFGTPAEVDED